MPRVHVDEFSYTLLYIWVGSDAMMRSGKMALISAQYSLISAEPRGIGTEIVQER